MAKPPVPGTVKTRLSPPLTSEQSARLAGAFLRDTVLLAMTAPECDIQVVLAEADHSRTVDGLIPPEIAVSVQSGPDLAAGMCEAIVSALDDGIASVAVIGADSPTMPASYISRAFNILDDGNVDVVLGPGEDGGYYLLATNNPVPELFTAIDWGTERVLEQTLTQIETAGLSVEQLPVWYDIDEVEQLERLVNDLGMDGSLNASATRIVLNDLLHDGAIDAEVTSPWRLDRTNIVASSPWRDFVIDTVTTHRGGQLDYYYTSQPDAVFVVPVTADGDIVLVRQYRHPVRDWMLEVPAGTVIAGQPLEEVARQELREEVGGIASELRAMRWFNPLGGSITLRAYIYLALDVELGAMDHEESELIHRLTIPHEIAFDMARRGEITEAQSALALLHCEEQIRAWLSG